MQKLITRFANATHSLVAVWGNKAVLFSSFMHMHVEAMNELLVM